MLLYMIHVVLTYFIKVIVVIFHARKGEKAERLVLVIRLPCKFLFARNQLLKTAVVV